MSLIIAVSGADASIDFAARRVSSSSSSMTESDVWTRRSLYTKEKEEETFAVSLRKDGHTVSGCTIFVRRI
jgi:hypothetical protein